ncbi:hypothetical protein BABINDRAFT_160454 [Babjeviella inositovora NRRL Y-12698]|uniref:Uncharacterized protein n=1 Tax=Babjeviella inositovora NRRL Y-12698 TaxID=984486 RepID=A0A1E3QTN2_9ASCO|nr:uncharacterized protein BABINDRAFT_160454 [Babjeviella inositovora NRRL Y-12698]ODQ81036.1 hypothetical protein BABINDRAFT_160454 [Babjeviella inositovora NRRL Y-12698]
MDYRNFALVLRIYLVLTVTDNILPQLANIHFYLLYTRKLNKLQAKGISRILIWSNNKGPKYSSFLP